MRTVISAPPSLLPRAFAGPARSPRLLVLGESGPETGHLLERLVRAGYTLMLTSSMREAVRLAAEHRPRAVLSHMGSPTDHMELARWLDADERTRAIPALHVRRGWKPMRTLERLARREAAAGVSPRLVIVANRGPNDFVCRWPVAYTPVVGRAGQHARAAGEPARRGLVLLRLRTAGRTPGAAWAVHHRGRPVRARAPRCAYPAPRAHVPRLLRPDQQRSAVDAPARPATAL